MYAERQEQIRILLQQFDLAGLALNAGPSLLYLTGLDFHLSERPVVLLLPVERDPAIIAPALEAETLARLEGAVDIFVYPDDPAAWPAVFNAACRHLEIGAAPFGIEPHHLRLLEYRFLLGAVPNLKLEDAATVIARLRSIKDAGEIECLRRAVGIAEDGFRATVPSIKAGMSERELATELTVQLLHHGSELPLPFPPIIASGPNGANPHARPTERRLTPGDLVVIDWGAAWKGYAADLTRTVAVGPLDQQARDLYELVRQANEAGRAAVRPGAACSSVDRAARAPIAAAGYGDRFTHRTGHGIGLECHEAPYIHAGNEDILEPGMTFTVEPGLYLPGRNGVRIEDDVAVTGAGGESLSTLCRDLITIS